MTNSKSTKRALFSSVVALLLCFTMLLGTTFAWFTDTATSATNKIVAGNLDVELYHADKAQPTDELVGSTTKLFDDVTLWEPGAIVWEKLTVKNAGSLALKYVLSVNVADISTVNGKSLADVLKVAVLTEEPTRDNVAAAATQTLETFNLQSDKALAAGDSDVAYVAIYWAPSANDNDYNVAGEALNATLGVTLLATQHTAESDSFDDQYDKGAEYPKFDSWDGTADTTWYSEEQAVFTLDTAEQFAGFGVLVSEGTTFENKTVNLDADLDLGLVAEFAYGKEWNWNVNHEPIGTEDSVFKGTFDGQGHAIENAFMNSYIWSGHTNQDMNAIGIFGYVEDATIKNVVLSNALAYGEGADFGGIVGKASGDCTFENITVQASTIAGYNNGSGGIVGEAGAGNYTFKNITVTADTVVGTTNKSFDTAIGGVIGQLDADAKVAFENITVACQLDAYNDVCASQQYWVYRRCGMLIGSVPTVTEVSDGVYQPDPATHGITCENVTVVFGDWADYHYCADSGAGARYARVEAGYQYAGVDVSKCNDLDQHLNIPFVELFGCQPPVAGAADGISEYEGVTVVNE